MRAGTRTLRRVLCAKEPATRSRVQRCWPRSPAVLTSLGDRWPAPRGSAPSVSSTAAVERPVGPEIDVAHDDVNGVCREALSMIGYPVYKFFHVLTIVALVAGL